jgi:hypothetical protein
MPRAHADIRRTQREHTLQRAGARRERPAIGEVGLDAGDQLRVVDLATLGVITGVAGVVGRAGRRTRTASPARHPAVAAAVDDASRL